MIANNINGTIKVFNSIPKVFELLPNIQNYNKLDSSVHYEDGFRDLVKPILEENQYLTNIYFNSDSDVFTYNVETYTPEQIKENEINNEFNFYQQRQTSGLNLYLKHEAEYRIMFLNDAITKDEFNWCGETLLYRYEQLIDLLEKYPGEVLCMEDILDHNPYIKRPETKFKYLGTNIEDLITKAITK